MDTFNPEQVESIDWPAGWERVKDQRFAAELEREICSTHVLAGKKITALAHRSDSDDVLFCVSDSARPFAVVHLTWKGREESPEWPATQTFIRLEECFAET